MMRTAQHTRPLFRILAGLLSFLCLLALIPALFLEDVKPWKFTITGACFLIFMAYVAVTGRMPRSLKDMTVRKLPEPYYSRLPDSQRWRDSFGIDFIIADRVLRMFCGAFMFSEEERYKFEPDDTVMAIYRVVYPSHWTPDALEHPILIDALEKEFDFTFPPTTFEKTASFRQIVAEIKDAQLRSGR